MNDSILKPLSVPLLATISILWARRALFHARKRSNPSEQSGLPDSGHTTREGSDTSFVRHGAGRIQAVPRSSLPRAASVFWGLHRFWVGSDRRGRFRSAQRIRWNLTRSTGKTFPEVRDEISSRSCTTDNSGCDNPHGQLSLCGIADVQKQRVLKLSVKFAINVVIGAQFINLSPSFLRPILGPFISPRERSVRKGMEHLGSLIEYKLAQEEALRPYLSNPRMWHHILGLER
ncbi:hypothetical protein K438DRAFT_1779706 [Mycena galopus ATCC 62051]|nr:hypothetical protein K438DRAFT_1779706 [Mycena galopus ATCC 62051]